MNSSRNHQRFIDHYHATKDQIYTYLMVRVNFDRALAEDLLMDVILKAYENFSRFDPQKGAFKTWIFTLTHNHLINYWRDSSKKKPVSLDKLEKDGFVPSIAHQNNVDQDLNQEKIQHVLSLLKEPEREIITLRYLQDLDYEEISQIIGKKEGAIRTSLSRAMNRFSKIYNKLYK